MLALYLLWESHLIKWRVAFGWTVEKKYFLYVYMFCACTFSEGAAGAGSRAPASGVSAPAVTAECVTGRVSERERGERHQDDLVLGWNFKVMTSSKLLVNMSQEKLLLREQLWRRGAELEQQADFCYSLGSAACGLLWSSSARENAVTHWMADVRLSSTFQPCHLHVFTVAP